MADLTVEKVRHVQPSPRWQTKNKTKRKKNTYKTLSHTILLLNKNIFGSS